MLKIRELGCPGHFICASQCRFRRHTQVGTKYRVSTVGDYYPTGQKERKTIGAGADSYFETMVFETVNRPAKDNDRCGCLEVTNWSEMDGRRHSTAGEALKYHDQIVKKYAKR